jgi:uncharacterized protein YbaR (Trm112 family)
VGGVRWHIQRRMGVGKAWRVLHRRKSASTQSEAASSMPPLSSWAWEVLACPITGQALRVDAERGVVVSDAAGVEWPLDGRILTLHPYDARRVPAAVMSEADEGDEGETRRT